MKRVVLISMAMCCLALTGCVIHDHHRHPLPRAGKIVVPVPVVVETATPGRHCPPGQAKKGKC
jgi:hypothetical protein